MKFIPAHFVAFLLLTIVEFSSQCVADNSVPLYGIHPDKGSLQSQHFLKTVIEPEIVADYINENHALDGIVFCSVLNVGINDIYLVEAKAEKFALRLSRAEHDMAADEFCFELEWLEFLHQHGVPVSYPIRRSDNLLLGSIKSPEGPRYATLFSYAEGTTDMNEEQAYILGRALAKLHLVSDTFVTTLNRVTLDRQNLIDGPIQTIKESFDASMDEEVNYLNFLSKELKDRLESIEKTEGVFGIVAGDVHGYNQHFTENNQLTMFDFEFCAYGYRIYDLATFRWSRGSDNLELWHAFLDGYQSIRVLNKTEIESIDAFVKIRNLWWMGCILKMPEYKEMLGNDFWEYVFARFVPKAL